MIIILTENWMIQITWEQSWIYMVLIEKQFYTSADVYTLGYGCGVSQYHQFYDWDLDKYQVLPRLYLGYFEGDNGEKSTQEKWVLDL